MLILSSSLSIQLIQNFVSFFFFFWCACGIVQQVHFSQELEIRAENVNGNEEMLELQKKILGFYSEMVMLLHYSVINFAGRYTCPF